MPYHTIQFLKENGYRFELIPQGRTLLAPPQEAYNWYEEAEKEPLGTATQPLGLDRLASHSTPLSIICVAH